MEHVEWTHPLRVTLGKVVVNGNHMNTAASQGIEEHWQSSDEGLTLTSGHLSNLALMQHRAANELHVVVDHVPGHLVAASLPGVEIGGFVAVHLQEVVSVGRQLAVEVGGSHLNLLVLGEAACGILDDGKEHLFLQFVNFSPHGLSFLIFECLDFGFYSRNLVALWLHIILNLLTYCSASCAQLIVRQPLYFRINGLYFMHYGHEFLQVSLTLVAED